MFCVFTTARKNWPKLPLVVKSSSYSELCPSTRVKTKALYLKQTVTAHDGHVQYSQSIDYSHRHWSPHQSWTHNHTPKLVSLNNRGNILRQTHSAPMGSKPSVASTNSINSNIERKRSKDSLKQSNSVKFPKISPSMSPVQLHAQMIGHQSAFSLRDLVQNKDENIESGYYTLCWKSCDVFVLWTEMVLANILNEESHIDYWSLCQVYSCIYLILGDSYFLLYAGIRKRIMLQYASYLGIYSMKCF